MNGSLNDWRFDFEAWMSERHPSVELTRDKDAWGRERYMHSHVRALYEGFVAGSELQDARVKGCLV